MFEWQLAKYLLATVLPVPALALRLVGVVRRFTLHTPDTAFVANLKVSRVYKSSDIYRQHTRL